MCPVGPGIQPDVPLKRPAGASRLARVLLSAAVFVFIGEAAARYFPIDDPLLAPLLYYRLVTAGHRVSDGERLFEPVPGARATAFENVATINEMGFRDRPRRLEKAPGVFRIIVLGGSNVYGAVVRDDETFTVYLESELRRAAGRPVEVWNAGISAYTVRQNVQDARRLLAAGPDLLIFQVTNSGRRAFLPNASPRDFFRRDPSLYLENLRFLPFVSRPRLAVRLMKVSALWRTAVLAVNRFTPARNNWFFNSDAPNVQAFREFVAECPKNVRVVLMKGPIGSPRQYAEAGMPMLDVFTTGKPASPERSVAAPPGYAYRWHAGQTAGPLVELAAERPEKCRPVPVEGLVGWPRPYAGAGTPLIEFFPADRPAPREYSKAHPPAYVYRWLAGKMAKRLVERGFVPPAGRGGN